MLRPFSRFAFVSNGFYVVPLYMAYAAHLLLGAVLLVALIISSGLFHYYNEKKFIRVDLLTSLLVSLWAAIVCVTGDFKYPYVPLALVFAFTALTIRMRLEKGNRGGTYHGLWHICIAATLVLCVLTYTG